MADQMDGPDVAERSSSVPQQWRSVLKQVTVIRRLRSTLEGRDRSHAPGEILGKVQPVDGDYAISVGDTVSSQYAHLSDEEKAFILSVHTALVQQLNTHGIILTLLLTITFVVFLQPPGSFDDKGHARSTTPVTCFLFFSSVSFTFACAGLLMVGIASASLFRPKFFPGSEKFTRWIYFGSDKMDSEDKAVFDSEYKICRVLMNNIQKLRRLRMYMTFSFIACIVAFIAAGLAVTHGKNMIVLIAGICVGGLPFTIEALLFTVTVFRQKNVREVPLLNSVQKRLTSIVSRNPMSGRENQPSHRYPSG